jgi:hypothetical protein
MKDVTAIKEYFRRKKNTLEIRISRVFMMIM